MKAIIFTGHDRHAGLDRTNGAYRIATLLRSHGWDIEVIDFVYIWTYEQLEQLIEQRSKLDWIGFSATWFELVDDSSIANLMKLLNNIKIKNPDTKIIAGGQNISVSKEIYKDVDYAISGFGEVAILKLLKYLYSNGDKPVMKFYPENKLYFIDANTDYSAWPIADLGITYEERDFIDSRETLSLEFSRGCKFACAFCSFPVLGVKEDTTRDITGLELDLKRNYDLYGVINYQVADETLNDRDEKLEKIANVVNRLDFNPNFSAFLRGDILFARPQQLEMLAEARVWGQYFGIETFNHETGKAVGKGMHPDKIKQGLIDTKEYFNNKIGLYRGTISLVYGLPYETVDSVNEGLSWMENNWRDQGIITFPYSLGTSEVKSKIDENYINYGYTMLDTIPVVTEEFNRASFHHRNPSNWTNGSMTRQDAIRLAEYQQLNVYGKSNNWDLWSLMGCANNIEEAVRDFSEIETTETRKRADAVAESIKYKYVEKKLNYGT
jgi:hypothetical protein